MWISISLKARRRKDETDGFDTDFYPHRRGSGLGRRAADPSVQLGRHRADSDPRQLSLDPGGRLPRLFHAGRVRHGGGRVYAGQERHQHHDEESHGLFHGFPGLLGGGVRTDVRSLQFRLDRDLRIFPERLYSGRGPLGAGVLDVPGGFCRHRGHHRFRGHGRADQVFGVSLIQHRRQRADLSHLRLLGMGEPL